MKHIAEGVITDVCNKFSVDRNYIVEYGGRQHLAFKCRAMVAAILYESHLFTQGEIALVLGKERSTVSNAYTRHCEIMSVNDPREAGYQEAFQDLSLWHGGNKLTPRESQSSLTYSVCCYKMHTVNAVKRFAKDNEVTVSEALSYLVEMGLTRIAETRQRKVRA